MRSSNSVIIIIVVRLLAVATSHSIGFQLDTTLTGHACQAAPSLDFGQVSNVISCASMCGTVASCHSLFYNTANKTCAGIAGYILNKTTDCSPDSNMRYYVKRDMMNNLQRVTPSPSVSASPVPSASTQSSVFTSLSSGYMPTTTVTESSYDVTSSTPTQSSLLVSSSSAILTQDMSTSSDMTSVPPSTVASHLDSSMMPSTSNLVQSITVSPPTTTAVASDASLTTSAAHLSMSTIGSVTPSVSQTPSPMSTAESPTVATTMSSSIVASTPDMNSVTPTPLSVSSSVTASLAPTSNARLATMPTASTTAVLATSATGTASISSEALSTVQITSTPALSTAQAISTIIATPISISSLPTPSEQLMSTSSLSIVSTIAPSLTTSTVTISVSPATAQVVSTIAPSLTTTTASAGIGAAAHFPPPYFGAFHRRPTDTPAPPTTPPTTASSSMYGTPCNYNTDCAMFNTACRDNVCQCTRELRYNPSRDLCVYDCQSYGDTYILFANMVLAVPTLADHSRCSLEDCKRYCVDNIRCRGFSFNSGTCRLKERTPHTDSTSFIYHTGFDYYARNCEL